jgi:hypothetical protein
LQQRQVADRGLVQYKRVGMGMGMGMGMGTGGDADTAHDPVLDKWVLAPRIYRPVVLYCKPYFMARDRDGPGPAFETRTLNLGGSVIIQTLAPPTTRLTAEYIEEAKPLRELRRLIMKHRIS